MASRNMRLIALSSLAVALGLSVAGTAVAQPKTPPRPSVSHCLVTYSDGTQEWVGPGGVVGNYVCIAGQWYTFFPGFDVLVNDVTDDVLFGTTADDFTINNPADAVTISELSTIARMVSGREGGSVERLVIVAGTGRVLTETETRLLLAGDRVDGVIVLDTISQPSDSLSLAEITRELGPVQLLLQWTGGPRVVGTIRW
jgi:hypothetical protein